MPIRPELRHLYRTPEWKALRAKVFKRARGRCEQCRKPAGREIFTYTWQTWEAGPGLSRKKLYHMVWIATGCRVWRDESGHRLPKGWWPAQGLPRRIRSVITVAHLDGDARNMD